MNNPADVIRKFIDERAEVASKATPGEVSISHNEDHSSCGACVNTVDGEQSFPGEECEDNAFIADARNSASKWEAIAREMLGALESIGEGRGYLPEEVPGEVAHARAALSKCARIIEGETG